MFSVKVKSNCVWFDTRVKIKRQQYQPLIQDGFPPLFNLAQCPLNDFWRASKLPLPHHYTGKAQPVIVPSPTKDVTAIAFKSLVSPKYVAEYTISSFLNSIQSKTKA